MKVETRSMNQIDLKPIINKLVSLPQEISFKILNFVGYPKLIERTAEHKELRDLTFSFYDEAAHEETKNINKLINFIEKLRELSVDNKDKESEETCMLDYDFQRILEGLRKESEPDHSALQKVTTKVNDLRRTMSSPNLLYKTNSKSKERFQYAINEIISLVWFRDLKLEEHEALSYYLKADSSLNLYLQSKDIPSLDLLKKVCQWRKQEREIENYTAEQLNCRPEYCSIKIKREKLVFQLFSTIDEQKLVPELVPGRPRDYVLFLRKNGEWKKAVDFCAALDSEHYDVACEELETLFEKMLKKLDLRDDCDNQKFELLLKIFNCISIRIENNPNIILEESRRTLKGRGESIIHALWFAKEDQFDFLIKILSQGHSTLRNLTEKYLKKYEDPSISEEGKKDLAPYIKFSKQYFEIKNRILERRVLP